MSSRRRFILHLSAFILLFAALLIAAVAATTVNSVTTPTATPWRPPVVSSATPDPTATPGWWADQPTPFAWKTPTQTPTVTLTPTPTSGAQP